MLLERLEVGNFRNCRSLTLELGPGQHVLVGDNGEGKSNLLEAVSVLGSLQSFRTRSLDSLVAWGADAGHVAGRVVCGGAVRECAVRLQGGRRTAFLARKPVGRAMQYLQGMRVVAFSPEDLFLLRDHPEERRRLLDRGLASVSADYGSRLLEYGQLLRQRNALLRDLGESKGPGWLDALEAWDEALARAGGYLIRRRREYVAALGDRAGRIFQRLHREGRELALRYVPALGSAVNGPEDPEAALGRALRANRRLDLVRGFTGVGPHRDDVHLLVDGRPARRSVSQGENRLLLLALRLAEAELHRELAGEAPLLLLDDALSELDAGHRERLMENLASCRQVIATACRSDGWSGREVSFYRVRGGTVVPETMCTAAR